MTPIVGLVRPGFTLNPDSFEVAEVFEVPLAFFLAADSRRMESRVWQGHTRYFYVYPYRDYYIWGATAGMLNNLAEILQGQDEVNEALEFARRAMDGRRKVLGATHPYTKRSEKLYDELTSMQ